MTQINSLIQFTAGQKAVAADVNTNFETLRTANNSLDTALTNTNSALFSKLANDGSVALNALQSYSTVSVTGATNATPVVITATAHGRSTGDSVYISGVLGNTAANGTWIITKVDANSFSLNSSVGNGAYSSGGTVYLLPSSPQNLTPKQYVDNTVNTTFSNITNPLNVPYSVNSAAVSSGYASFISSLSNSSIKIAASATPIVLTHPDGWQETVSTDQTITGLGNGTFTVIKEKANNTVVASSCAVTESSVAPSSPNNGDYWLNIGVKPYAGYKRVSGAWSALPFTKLGEVTISGGVMGTPISYAFNGRYLSSDTACTSGSTATTFIHNIGTNNIKPPLLQLRNYTAEQGFSIGDIVINPMTNQANTSIDMFTPCVNKNTIIFGTGSAPQGYWVIPKTAGGYVILTPANWKQFVIAERGF